MTDSTAVATQDTDDEPAEGIAQFVARVAISHLSVTENVDYQALYKAVTSALRGDSRVEMVEAPTQGEDNFWMPTFTPPDDDEDESDDGDDAEAAPDPFSHVHAFCFQEPIVLRVRSPRRLQPRYGSFEHIPSEVYWAAWDGLTLVVLWEREDGLIRSLSPSGGLLVQDILSDAAKKCNVGFSSVPCSTNCSYEFAHSDLVVNTTGEDNDTVFHPVDGDTWVYVHLASEQDPKAAVEELFRSVAFLGRVFARARSDVRGMESAARNTNRDVVQLLRIQYYRASLAAEPFFRSLKARWRSRHWKRDARKLVARICLGLAMLERARSDWRRTKDLYQRAARDHDVGSVFTYEFELGESATSAIEVAEARSAIDRVTGSLDTRALVLATAVGAIVGAVVGAAAGTLF